MHHPILMSILKSINTLRKNYLDLRLLKLPLLLINKRCQIFAITQFLHNSQNLVTLVEKALLGAYYVIVVEFYDGFPFSKCLVQGGFV
jgi:hypothetical protein